MPSPCRRPDCDQRQRLADAACFFGPIDNGFKIIRKMVKVAINAMYPRSLTMAAMIIAVNGNIMGNKPVGQIVIAPLMST